MLLAYWKIAIIAMAVLGSLLPVRFVDLTGFAMYAFSVLATTTIVVLFVMKEPLLGLAVATLYISVLMKVHVRAVDKLKRVSTPNKTDTSFASAKIILPTPFDVESIKQSTADAEGIHIESKPEPINTPAHTLPHVAKHVAKHVANVDHELAWPIGANGVNENPYAQARPNTYKGTQTLTPWT